MFIGRKEEIKSLQSNYNSSKSELVAIYGRRRIGKSKLIQEFIKNKNNTLSFEAIEHETTPGQIQHFTNQLKTQDTNILLDSINFQNWNSVFDYIGTLLKNRKQKNKKIVLVFDEIQWMASGRNKLISLIKYYWDNHWKEHNAMLILCGSIASFMIKQVINSKALYGRITHEMNLKGLNPREAAMFFGTKRSKEEILKYQLLFGGVPKYLEGIDTNLSFEKNINSMCFTYNGVMVNEIEKIFYNQFKDGRKYLQIINALQKNNTMSLKEISNTLKIISGGGVKSYLNNLVKAEIIKENIPFDKSINSKLKRYSLEDEYIHFYFKYILPNIKIIKENRQQRSLFKILTEKSFSIWMGFAFERFCVKNAYFLAEILDFDDKVFYAAPYFSKTGTDNNFQIDLLYKRSDDIITLCEIKNYNKKITTKIIPEIEKKCSLYKIPKGYTYEKMLVSLYGPDEALKDSQYFNYHIKLDDMF